MFFSFEIEKHISARLVAEGASLGSETCTSEYDTTGNRSPASL